jgi:acyl transferase domain-containing protein
MDRKIVFLCAGQGTQYFNMTLKLYKNNKTYQKHLDSLSQKVYERTGYKILQYLFDSNKPSVAECDNLVLSSLAIFICQFGVAKMLIDIGFYPACVIGQSMGEFVALAISNEQNVDTVIDIIASFTGRITKECQTGGMMAVLHNSNLFFERKDIFQQCEIAGISYNEHFVVSGTSKALDVLTCFFREHNIMFQRLPVHYAFHSRYIEEEREKVLEKKIDCKLNLPIGSCAYGKLIYELPQSYIWDVVRRPMLFRETVWEVEDLINPVYIDLSPGGILENYIKYGNISENKVDSIISRYHKENEKIEKLVREYL